MANNHTYQVFTSSNYNGILHILTTDADNIMLANLNAQSYLGDNDEIGVNGGWFEASSTNALLNIAIQDGTPVGTGGHWNACGQGIIAWNGLWLFSRNDLQVGTDLAGSFYYNGSWIQGGIPLQLGKTDWLTLARAQYDPEGEDYYGEKDWRTAMVADMGLNVNKVYLIVAGNKMTPTIFRAVIQEFLGVSEGSTESALYKGIMLDGGRSSQIVAIDDAAGRVIQPVKLLGRKHAQVVVLRDNT